MTIFKDLEQLGFFAWLQKEVDTDMYLEILLCTRPESLPAMSEIVNALVFRWARQEHKIYPHICYLDEEEVWSVDIYNLANKMGLINNPMEHTGYASPEGAQSKAVEVTLKIIKERNEQKQANK